jgi:hypothetical protein
MAEGVDNISGEEDMWDGDMWDGNILGDLSFVDLELGKYMLILGKFMLIFLEETADIRW